jgi:DNA-binding beta-propeller fold protein YncE
MRRWNLSCGALSSCVTAALLAGCGGSQPPIGAPGAMPQSLAITTQRTFPEALPPLFVKTGSYLYAADCCGVLNHGDVTVYYPGQTKIERHFVKGAFNPTDTALDRTGTLYVLDQSYAGPEGIAVTEFDRGSATPSRRIKGFYWATTVALDRSNNLYVANCNTCVDSGDGAPAAARDSITVYRPKQTKVLRTITQGIHKPYSIAFDHAGNLYVANGKSKHVHPSITVYGPGSNSILREITQKITIPISMALDESGDVFLINGDIFKAEVIEYAPDSSKVLRTITDGISGPRALALDASGALYVANWPSAPSGPGWVSVYAPDSSSPEYKIVRAINGPLALALDGGGNLYVANIRGRRGRVSVYAANARKPLRSMISGRFGEPRALAFGPQP